MRMSKTYVWLSLLDFAAFVAAWIWKGIPRDTANAALPVALYWVTAFGGLLLAVYGFLVLTRGSGDQLSKSVLCILFALTPGCVGLIALLSHLGAKPV